LAAFDLLSGTPISAFPTANGIPYITVYDAGNYHAVPSAQYIKSTSNLWVPVSATDPMFIETTGRTPGIYNVTMTNANTEYSQALTNCKKFIILMRENDTAFRIAFVTGKVATSTVPYFTVPEGSSYDEDNINFTGTIYFACASAGKTIQIIAWS
jgi:hypothetical protein